jgi:hypothetical protein
MPFLTASETSPQNSRWTHKPIGTAGCAAQASVTEELRARSEAVTSSAARPANVRIETEGSHYANGLSDCLIPYPPASERLGRQTFGRSIDAASSELPSVVCPLPHLRWTLPIPFGTNLWVDARRSNG